MASRTGINISGHYGVSINVVPFYICTLNSKKLKGRTESCLMFILKLNKHQTRCFNFGLRRTYANCCKF